MDDDASEDRIARSEPAVVVSRWRKGKRSPGIEEIDYLDQNFEVKLERARRARNVNRNERWEDVRQTLTILMFAVGFLLILFALGMSIFILFTRSTEPVELARWTLETLLGAFIAGLIGFFAVKSFEK